MTGYALNHRLLHPRTKIGFSELAETWREDTISLSVKDMGGFARSPSLLNKLRGALGGILKESGSNPVQNRQLCNWTPACASEVFFGRRPTIEIGQFSSEISKPYVLFAFQRGRDLEIGISVFGAARSHIPEIRAALVQALRKRLRWHQFAEDGGLFIPAELEISCPSIVGTNGIAMPPVPGQVCLEFVTPLDAERGQMAENPHLIFERLARRLYMMARWFDAELAIEWADLEKSWMNCTYPLSETADGPVKSRGGHKFRNIVVRNQELSIHGNLAPLWPLLVVGERTNLGRGASIGLGKYTMLPQ